MNNTIKISHNKVLYTFVINNTIKISHNKVL